MSTRALTPQIAVLLNAVLNFLDAFASIKVAATIAKGIVNPDAITLNIVLAGLVGAITWNLLTWLLGLPSSSSHALIGGIAGAAIAAVGWNVIEWNGLWNKVVKPSVLAPVIGFFGALLLMLVLVWLIRRRSPSKVNRVARIGQIFSGSFVAFTHGTNDAQKTMGIISLALIASGHLQAEPFTVPTWVIVSSATAMAIGTYAGGWRIIKTLGTRIAKIDPPQGFAAQTRRCQPQALGRSLARRRQHRDRMDTHAPRGRARGSADGARDPASAGDLIVFLLAGVIAAAAFVARRYEVRSLVPATA